MANVKITLLLLVSCLFVSCSESVEPHRNGTAVYDTFMIEVDSISTPVTVDYGGEIPVRFYGTIGDNTCYSFCKFESSKEQYTVRISVYGRFNTSADWCGDKMVYLNEVCTVEPSPSWLYGYIHVEVAQPDGSTLVDSVHVGEFCEPGYTYAVPVEEVVEISYETFYPACDFIEEFDSRMLRFLDKWCEYLSPGLIGGPYRCYWRFRALRPGRTCAVLECFHSEPANFTVIVTP